jgi:hypothetical protein
MVFGISARKYPYYKRILDKRNIQYNATQPVSGGTVLIETPLPETKVRLIRKTIDTFVMEHFQDRTYFEDRMKDKSCVHL